MPELPSEACQYALSILGALLRMAQSSGPLIQVDIDASNHEFIQRVFLVSESTRTHFPLKAKSMKPDEVMLARHFLQPSACILRLKQAAALKLT